MNYNKVLLIGLGGAGQRHLRILRGLLPADTQFIAYRRYGKTPLLNPDFTVDSSRTLEEAYGLVSFSSLESAFADGPDLTVVATPTSTHRKPMALALEAGSGIIVEKPWAESLKDFDTFREGVMAKRLPFQISFQRRFHPLISKARELVVAGHIGKPVSANFSVYSYVPAWHPYEDWRSLYAVRKELGGGVLLTECHEFDLAYWYFGLPAAVFCSGGSRVAPELDVEDTVQMTLLYADFSVQIDLCFLHAQPSRHFHITGTRGCLTWSGNGDNLKISTFDVPRTEQVSGPGFSNDSMFVAQAQAFLHGWAAADTQNALAAAGSCLAIIEAARCSMVSGRAEPVSPP
jgi:predicted dehydrogenase